MKFVFAETVEDVLNASLEKPKKPAKAAAKKKTTKAKNKTNA
jgi:hypothetical protein